MSEVHQTPPEEMQVATCQHWPLTPHRAHWWALSGRLPTYLHMPLRRKAVPMDYYDIKLGSKYRDTITGFEGTCTARSEYINGCLQAALVAPSKDGKPGEVEWFDYQRLELVGAQLGAVDEAPQLKRTGGPQQHTAPTSAGHR